MPHQAILWNPSWNLNIPSIDSDHKNIVKAINALDKNLGEQGEQRLMNKLFDALDAYTRIHFNREIDLLIECNFTDIENHEVEHSKFLEKIEFYRAKCSGEFDHEALKQEIRTYLLDWLVVHIDQTDRKYQKHLIAAGVQ